MNDRPSETTDLPTILRYLAQFQGPPVCDRMAEAAIVIDKLSGKSGTRNRLRDLREAMESELSANEFRSYVAIWLETVRYAD